MTTSLQMHYLVAMPRLHNSYFERCVILLLKHDRDGAMGVVLNKPLEIAPPVLFKQLELPTPKSTLMRFTHGGPVAEDRGLLLHRNTTTVWRDSVTICDQLAMTSSVDIVQAIAHDQGPKQVLFALGHSGWNAGQLETELRDNSWLSLPANADDLFTLDQQTMLTTITRRSGIDYNKLVGIAGHA